MLMSVNGGAVSTPAPNAAVALLYGVGPKVGVNGSMLAAPPTPVSWGTAKSVGW